ncbi:AEC family transporter [Desulfococcus sp.]|uniref:AEC family transporter n=1 Tax=Desulfococcus sp. TaxID=2025834 RepID=UPI0035937830
MVVLNGLFPVLALLFLGGCLKKLRLTNDAFLKTADKLVYFIFFPAMLFWKIGGARTADGIHWPFCLASLTAVGILYLISAGVILLAVPEFEAGSFSQACYRFNTYIGMAVILGTLGEEGARHFGIMVGFAIPIINTLAVSTLIWHSGRRFSPGERLRITGRALVSNPLILACAAGILHARLAGAFPAFIDGAFKLATSVTLPLALISIGGTLTFETLRGHLKLSLVAAALKLILFPLVGYTCLKYYSVSGVPFKVGMIFFALPTSTAIYVLSSQLNSSTALASASIVVSTLLSFIPLSIVLLL